MDYSANEIINTKKVQKGGCIIQRAVDANAWFWRYGFIGKTPIVMRCNLRILKLNKSIGYFQMKEIHETGIIDLAKMAILNLTNTRFIAACLAVSIFINAVFAAAIGLILNG